MCWHLWVCEIVSLEINSLHQLLNLAPFNIGMGQQFKQFFTNFESLILRQWLHYPCRGQKRPKTACSLTTVGHLWVWKIVSLELNSLQQLLELAHQYVRIGLYPTKEQFEKFFTNWCVSNSNLSTDRLSKWPYLSGVFFHLKTKLCIRRNQRDMIT